MSHDCRDGCTGARPARDRWNERTGHWYCPNGNDNCAAHTVHRCVFLTPETPDRPSAKEQP